MRCRVLAKMCSTWPQFVQSAPPCSRRCRGSVRRPSRTSSRRVWRPAARCPGRGDDHGAGQRHTLAERQRMSPVPGGMSTSSSRARPVRLRKSCSSACVASGRARSSGCRPRSGSRSTSPARRSWHGAPSTCHRRRLRLAFDAHHHRLARTVDVGIEDAHLRPSAASASARLTPSCSCRRRPCPTPRRSRSSRSAAVARRAAPRARRFSRSPRPSHR